MFASERRVVITGLGAVTPIGLNVNDYWNGLEAGANGIRRMKNIDVGDYHVQIAAEIDLPEDLREHFVAKKMVKRLDRFILMGAWAGAQALADSGYPVEKDPSRIGAIIGSGEGGLGTHWDMIDRLRTKGLSSASPFYITNVIPNSPAAFLCQERNLQGPSFAISSACASSNHAFGVAISLIRSGMADAILAGGSEAVATPPSIAAFGVIGALSSRNDDPETASRPFDSGRDGFVMGEGAGVLVLEELEHARARGAKIYAEITGFGFTTDAFDLVAPHPEGKGAAASIRQSLASARLNPEDIGFINAHGTSTPVGDQAESLAINAAFGPEFGSRVPVHSTKSMIGHLIGAAGAVEAIACLMAFERGVIHKSRNLFNQDPGINLNILRENADGHKVNHILSNAFGFGGHNASLILSRFKG